MASRATEPEQLLTCPLCDYDLRGQVDPRCPECGYTFDWEDLRDPARRKHRYLFEHHPERNVRSFLRTLVGGLLPRRFWAGLLPSQPSNPPRLFIYAMIIALSASVPPLVLTLLVMQQEWTQMRVSRTGMIAALSAPRMSPGFQRLASRGATTQQIVDQVAPAPTVGRVLNAAFERRLLSRTLTAHAIMLLWPALSFLSLMIFLVSMHRARLRPEHFVRCVVYGGDIILWANLLLAAFVAAVMMERILTGVTRFADLEEAYGVAAACVFAAALLAFVYRLIVAFRKYLRFDHPISTVLSTQFIVFLLVLIVLTYL